MSVAIPNRPVFRAQEVCELAEVQPYVLRTWEAEFPDLGVAKSGSGPRVYRRADVARVLRIKHLLFVDGLTLAGARRRLSEEGPAPVDESVTDADVAAMIDGETRQQLRDVRRGLQWILGVLSGDETTFALTPAASVRPPAKWAKAGKSSSAAKTGAAKARPGKPAKKAGKKKH
jgi:DNA-binding transcriptional MerR regulator